MTIECSTTTLKPTDVMSRAFLLEVLPDELVGPWLADLSVAALRYGVMSKPEPSDTSQRFDPLAPIDYDQIRRDMQRELLRKHGERLEDVGTTRERAFGGGRMYVDV
jgi:hypothetical protein